MTHPMQEADGTIDEESWLALRRVRDAFDEFKNALRDVGVTL